MDGWMDGRRLSLLPRLAPSSQAPCSAPRQVMEKGSQPSDPILPAPAPRAVLLRVPRRETEQRGAGPDERGTAAKGSSPLPPFPGRGWGKTSVFARCRVPAPPRAGGTRARPARGSGPAGPGTGRRLLRPHPRGSPLGAGTGRRGGGSSGRSAPPRERGTRRTAAAAPRSGEGCKWGVPGLTVLLRGVAAAGQPGGLQQAPAGLSAALVRLGGHHVARLLQVQQVTHGEVLLGL